MGTIPTTGNKVSRRSAIKKIAGVGSLSTAGFIGIPHKVLADPYGGDYKFKDEDTGSYADGNLVTGFHRHYTDYNDSTGNWTIPLGVNANASTQGNGGINYWIDDSVIEATWNETPTHDIYTQTGESKFFTGSSTPTYNPNQTDYSGILEPVVDYARGRLIDKAPYGTELMVIGETVDNMIESFTGSDGGPNYEYVDKHFNWYDGVQDVSYWSKYEVHGGTGDSETMEVDSYSNKGYINSIELHTNTTVLCNYPDVEPSTLSKMTTRKREQNGIRVARGSDVKRNPSKWGISPYRARQFDDGPVYFVPPTKEEVEMNT